MLMIPVDVAADGTISASEPASSEAICTITTPAGCEVYMPGDEVLLADRLAAQDQLTNEESQ